MMTTKSSIFISLMLAMLAGCSSDSNDSSQSSHTQTVDVQIVGGLIADGSSNEPKEASLEISAGKISYVGPERQVNAKERINAQGMIVSPGFIDPHTHAGNDLKKPALSTNEPSLRQGITTVFIGNDGGGRSVTEAKNYFLSHSVGTNIALFRGHGALRREFVGTEDRAPTAEELQNMQAELEKDMQAGAIGLSAGLFYAPGSYAETEEVIALAKIASKYNGVYDTHIRDESNYNIGLLAAVDETLEIGREADIAVHIAHIKALGPAVHGLSEAIIDKVEKAQSSGLTVTADQYPWLASGTRISNALIPREAMSGGVDAMRKRLQDPAYLEQIEDKMAANLVRRGGAGAILITGKSDYQGKTLAELSADNKVDELSMAVEIVLAGDPSIASFMMNQDDVSRFIQRPWVMTGSDGTTGHPRKYGSFPKKYEEYVLNQKVISLKQFVHSSTGLTASSFGLCNMGFLKEGYIADIAIWDPSTFRSQATYEAPAEFATGVRDLMVNGVWTIRENELTGAKPGRVIDKSKCN